MSEFYGPADIIWQSRYCFSGVCPFCLCLSVCPRKQTENKIPIRNW